MFCGLFSISPCLHEFLTSSREERTTSKAVRRKRPLRTYKKRTEPEVKRLKGDPRQGKPGGELKIQFAAAAIQDTEDTAR
jgi:hypothetical protein